MQRSFSLALLSSWLIPLLLMLLLIVVAWIGLDTPPWLDEMITMAELEGRWLMPVSDSVQAGMATASTALPALAPTTDPALVRDIVIGGDVHPPLYYTTLLAWAWIGGMEPAWLRFFSLLCTAGAAAAMVQMAQLFARTDSGRLVCGLAILLLLACSPGFLFAATNIRNYGMALFFTAIALLAIARMWESGRGTIRQGVFVGLFSGLAISTHYFAMLVLLVPLCATAVRFTQAPRAVMTALGAFFLTALPIVPILLVQMGARPDQYHGFGTWVAEFRDSVVKTAWTIWPVGLPGAIIGAIALGAWTARRAKTAPATTPLALGAASFPLLLLALFATTDKSLAQAGTRYSIFALPALAPLLAAAIGSGFEWAARRGFPGLPALSQRAIEWSIPSLIALGVMGAIAAAPAHHWSQSVMNVQASHVSMLSKRIAEVGIDRALIVLAKWRNSEGDAVLAELPPDTPVLIVRDPKTMFEELDRAIAQADVILMADIWLWTPPSGIYEKVVSYMEERGFVHTEETQIFSRTPLVP